MSLIEYITNNSTQCTENGDSDVVFFQVKKSPNAKAEDLKSLINEHKGSFSFCEVNLFDGKEHSYIEIGGWIGDQGLALMLMGLGDSLGLWKVLTPKNILGDACSDELSKELAGHGYITIVSQQQKE